MAGAADSDHPAVLQLLKTNTGGLVALVTQEHNIGYTEGCFQVYDASLPDGTLSPGMLFDKVDSLHDYPLFPGKGKAHLTLFPLIFTGDNQDIIIFFDFHSPTRPLAPEK